MTDSMYEDGAINSRLENVTALYDEDGSVKFVNDSLSSSNFDGSIFSITASVGVSQIYAGQLIGIESASAMSFYPIIKVEAEDPVLSSPYTGAHYIYYFDGNEITTASYSSSAASVVVKYDDWDNKDLGTAGWTITSNGNAIFSNIAARGRIEATSGYIGDAYSGWEIGANLLSNASVGFYAPSAFSSAEIAIFSGSPFTGRATAPFRVNYGGLMNATGASISGALTATTLNVGGSAGITYDGSIVTIGSSVVINSTLTTNSLQVGASPTLLRIANDVEGTNDGIYIDPYNFWYSDGKFSVGGSANSACWNGNALSVKGNIIATSGSFSGDITASAGRFVGALSVSSSGAIYAGTNVDSGQRTVLNASGLFGYHSSGVEAFALPVSGSPRLGTFTIIPTGIVSQSASNANMIYGNVDSSGSVTDGIVIRGSRISGASAAIYTVQNGVETSYATGNGFYVDENARFKLKGTTGSLAFDGTDLYVSGNINAISGQFTGSVNAQIITASNGNIGGWKIENNALSSSAGYGRVQISSSPAGISVVGPFGGGGVFLSASSPTFAMWAGDPDPTNAKFSIDYTGILKAVSASFTSAVISGSISAQTITASNGNISGFNISNTSLTKVNGLNWVGVTSGASAFFAGATSASGTDAKFLVSDTGSIFASNATITGDITATNITASVGNIAGFTLAKNQLSATNIIISSSGGFRLGSSSQFNVDISGNMSATSASIIGDIRSNSGSIAGWTLNTGLLSGTSASIISSGNIRLGSGQTIVALSSTDTNRIWAGSAVSTTAPFRVSSVGNLTATNADIRGLITSSSITGGLIRSASTGSRIEITDAATDKIQFIYDNADTSPAYMQVYSDDVTMYRQLQISGATKSGWPAAPYIIVQTGSGSTGANAPSIILNTPSPTGTIKMYGAATMYSTLSVLDNTDIFGNLTAYQLLANTTSGVRSLVATRATTTAADEIAIFRSSIGGADTTKFSFQANGRFRAEGDGSFGGDLTITGATTLNSTTDITGLLTTNRNVTAGTVNGITVNSTNNYITNWNAIKFTRNTVDLGFIRVASAVGAPTLVSASDYRLKENIQDDPKDFYQVIKELRPVVFEWKNRPDGEKTHGFIAHEVQKVIPEAVGGVKDEVDENGDIVPQDLTEQPFVYYIVGALKKAIAEIEGLQSQVQKLSDKIDALENKNI